MNDWIAVDEKNLIIGKMFTKYSKCLKFVKIKFLYTKFVVHKKPKPSKNFVSLYTPKKGFL